MREKPKRPTRLIVVGLIGIAILAVVGLVIAFAITKARDITPTVTESAEQCCSCHWSVEAEGGQLILDLGTLGGKIDNEECVIEGGQPNIGKESPTGCTDLKVGDVFGSDIPYDLDPDDDIIAEEYRPACTSGVLSHMSDPLLPPGEFTKDNPEVTLDLVYELYASSENEEITTVELSYEYPEEAPAPDPVTTDPESKGSEKIGNLYIKTYSASFTVRWTDIFDLDEPGNYSVKFRAQGDDGEWIPENIAVPNTYIHEYVLTDEMSGTLLTTAEAKCYNLDVVLNSGPSPLDVTLTADIVFPENAVTTEYKWMLDLNCDGEIDESGEGANPETFTTGSGTSSITQTFTRPASSNGSATCEANVYGIATNDEGSITLEEVSDGACTKKIITVNPPPETCGNGTCDEGETCETDGNLDCLGDTPLGQGYTCRVDCTYCGDGVLNGGEGCDINAEEGNPGYYEDCQDDCTIKESEEEPSAGGASESLTITQQTPQCLELVAPNNTSTITISVANGGTEDITINAVSDTLPQGLTYTAGSSVINNTANTDDTGVTTEASGSSQLITWDNNGAGWTIGAEETLGITFTITAGSTATIGSQTNRVTVTPADENPIPSESAILLAQVCTQPLTGIFDRTAMVILTGSLFLIIAGAAYYTGVGTKQFAILLDRTAARSKDLYLRFTQPQKIMEKNIESSALKHIKERSHASRKKRGKGRT